VYKAEDVSDLVCEIYLCIVFLSDAMRARVGTDRHLFNVAFIARSSCCRRCKNVVDASVSRSVWHAGSHKDAGGGPRPRGGWERVIAFFLICWNLCTSYAKRKKCVLVRLCVLVLAQKMKRQTAGRK